MGKQAIMERMKEAGLRLTPQREHIVELLFELSHPTAERIFSLMTAKFPYASQATVYNTLKKLKELGAVRELTHGDKSSHFEIAGSDHWHFHCRACGEIYDMAPMEQGAFLAAGSRNGAFRVDGYQVEFYGVCESCSEKA